MKIAVDFDGTIVEHKYPDIGKEKPFAIDVLKQLSSENHKIILWTVREGQLLDDAIEFCRKRGLTFYAVNSNVPEGSASHPQKARKLIADYYIDDRNVGGLPDWGMIYKMISRNLTYEQLANGSVEDFDDDEDDSPFRGGLLGRGVWRRRRKRR